MLEEKSVHDAERDGIAGNWPTLLPFTCAGCRVEKAFPPADAVKTETIYQDRLRADVAAVDAWGRLAGVVEIIYSQPPTQQALEAQESLGFAYYGLLSPPWRKESDAWLCCPECWVWYTKLSGGETSSPWEPRRCDGCGSYFHQNPLTWLEFRDWGTDPHEAYCIHWAAGLGQAQWRSPGELAGVDPRRRFGSSRDVPGILRRRVLGDGLVQSRREARHTLECLRTLWDGERDPEGCPRRMGMVVYPLRRGE